ncbi:MAG: aspartate ammonia-lyase [Planctomycetes bacterium]|nr:aspartate ammonia-lyase [Planctomycetota bacterium]
MNDTRTEKDQIGTMEIPVGALYGIHTARAMTNFPVAGQPVHAGMSLAYGDVKLACAMVNQELGVWANMPDKGEAIVGACREMSQGLLSDPILVDALQGGAGTSLNMNVNEVLANRALQILGKNPGEYALVSPLDDINLHQSTNDTFPTALCVAGIRQITALEQTVLALQEAFQEKEKAFAHVVKVGRTQFQDAVLTTLGREMGAYAEALNRDRWRIYKCVERLRVVNLGGTAIGTGLGAQRQFIFNVVDKLRELTGLNLARAENLVEATQNADVFAEVSGIIKAHAVTLVKISTDLRVLSSGPQAGFQEIHLPVRQGGSSIMPGKVNPVIPEAVTQAAMMVFGHDVTLTQACAAGTLELNPFLPLVAHCLLNSCDLLCHACRILRTHCVQDMQANEAQCQAHVNTSTATATALISVLGYDSVSDVLKVLQATGEPLKEFVIAQGLLDEETFEELTSPEAVCRLGNPKSRT